MSGKAKKIAVWVVSVLLAAEYAFASIPKLMGQSEAVQGFRQAGFSDGFRLFIGAAELAGAIGLLVPRLRFWAASGLSIIMIGAVVTHVRAGDTVAHMAPAVISLVLLVWTAWSSRRAAARA
jgi:putative oxidoreductase